MQLYSRYRKIRKLFRSPGLYFRDYLLKKYPVNLSGPASEQVLHIEEVGWKSVHDMLNQFRLKTPVLNEKNFDIMAFELSALLAAAARLSSRRRQQLFYIKAGALPASLTSQRAINDATKQAEADGILHLRICDLYGYQVDHASIIVWTPTNGSSYPNLQSRYATSPIKVWHSSIDISRSKAAFDLDVGQPIDVVFTWVNSDDPTWQKLVAPYVADANIDRDRYAQVNELKYAIRSIELHAPWVRNVYILTNCQKPAWFKETDRFRWVDHSEIIDKQYLPTFNSHAIETFLHRIPGLSRVFLYLNDDVMLTDVCFPDDFVEYGFRTVSYFEPYGTVFLFDQDQAKASLETWQRAAANGARMIQEDYGVFPLRLHQHVPHVLDVDLYGSMESKYKDAFDAVRKNKFRSAADISFTSFFYHHFAAVNGRSIPRTSKSFIVRSTNYRSFQRRISQNKHLYKFICLNDGNGSALDPAFNAYKIRLLNELFPFKSACET